MMATAGEWTDRSALILRARQDPEMLKRPVHAMHGQSAQDPKDLPRLSQLEMWSQPLPQSILFQVLQGLRSISDAEWRA